MEESKEYARKKNYLIAIGYAVIGIAIYYLFFRYVIYKAWPFFIAAIVAMILRGPVLWLSKKLKISEKTGSVILCIIFYVIAIGAGVFIVLKAFWGIVGWASNLYSMYSSSIEPFIEHVFNWYEEKVAILGGDTSYLDSFGQVILDKLSQVMSWVSSKSVSFAQSAAVAIPKALLGFIFMIVSTFFISIDYAKISHFLMGQLTPNQQQIFVSSKEYLGHGMLRLCVSYGLIMFITFCELNVFLRILHIASPTVVALLIAMFDILPALGTGGVVWPWIFIELFNGNTSLALGLFIMYLFITVVRNIIEPKIVGDNIGVHPVLMLLSIYLGASIFGVLGVLIVPFTLVIVKKLNDAGLINIFKSDYLAEDDKKKNIFGRIFKSKHSEENQ